MQSSKFVRRSMNRLTISCVTRCNTSVGARRTAASRRHIGICTGQPSFVRTCAFERHRGKGCNIGSIQIRSFQNVGQYHRVADETLETIQDAVEEYLEDNFDADADGEIPEVNYADGVLTISIPPRGTWVLNKQTPNEQIWWSSPVSGPRRYEYLESMDRWVYSRAIEAKSDDSTFNEVDTLGGILNKELEELFGIRVDDLKA